jgi:hypothetical protein
MICYKDRTFCNAFCCNVDCPLRYEKAVIEKANSQDAFVREVLPIAVSDFSGSCIYYTPPQEPVDAEFG